MTCPWLLAPLLITTAAAAQPAPPEAGTPAADPPKHTFLRYQEDWSAWRDRDGWPDAIKHVPLSEDGSVWASFGGHARARMESWSGFGFGETSAADDTFLLWRVLLHADIHVGDSLRVFVEGKTADSTDRTLPGGRRTLDVDTLALEQAFVDVTLFRDAETSLTLRPGRQQFLFGKQRLVSPLPWANTLRRWDGVSVILDVDAWNVHGFWSQFAPVRKYDFNQADRHAQFFGVYATRAPDGDGPALDLYLLGLDRDDTVAFNGTAGTEERYTIGGRLGGPIGETGLDYDVEAAYQFGSVGPGDVNAYMVGSQLGYRLPGDGWATRLFLGLDYASGDDAPGGDVETFNQLFPLGHAYYGLIDAVGRQNAIDLSLGVTTSPGPGTTLGITGHAFRRESDRDALYNAGGGVLRAGGLSDDREIGFELDLTLKHAFDRHLAALVGYSRFFAGDFIEESGPDGDIDFFYVQFQYTF